MRRIMAVAFALFLALSLGPAGAAERTGARGATNDALRPSSNPFIADLGEPAVLASLTWTRQTVDSGGSEPSLALLSDGRPCIAYYDATDGDLKYARWTGSTWQVETVESAGNVGGTPSLCLDADGHPHISYHDDDSGALKYTPRPNPGPRSRRPRGGSPPTAPARAGAARTAIRASWPT
jgi:hypothetical protein